MPFLAHLKVLQISRCPRLPELVTDLHHALPLPPVYGSEVEFLRSILSIVLQNQQMIWRENTILRVCTYFSERATVYEVLHLYEGGVQRFIVE